jgi:hypothetical protein
MNSPFVFFEIINLILGKCKVSIISCCLILLGVLYLAPSTTYASLQELTDVPAAAAPDEQKNASSEGDGAKPPSQFDPNNIPQFSSPLFSIMMWLGGIGGGVISFVFLLYINRRSLPFDWLIAMLPAFFVGYLMVFSPTMLDSKFYSNWSFHCLTGQPPDRNPAQGTYDSECQIVQTEYHALGYAKAVNLYRKEFLRGEGDLVYPSELKIIAWILLSIWSLAIYLMLVFVRVRLIQR